MRGERTLESTVQAGDGSAMGEMITLFFVSQVFFFFKEFIIAYLINLFIYVCISIYMYVYTF